MRTIASKNLGTGARPTLDEPDALVQDLREANAQLERINRYRSQFLVNMSHELRTPLHAIIGFSELLNDESQTKNLDPKYRAYANHISESGRHLLALINDVLDMSRIDAGRIDLHRQWVSPRELALSAADIIAPLAVKQGTLLEVEARDDSREIFVDPTRVKQVIYNLLSNAIKFTPRGGHVKLRVTTGASSVSIAVEDTGIGMRAEDLPRLFHEFERLENGSEREGTGIGLALTKRLVELHGGSIDVSSELGRGSVFTVDFPVRADLEAAAE
jgi:signal transduction histidine kinase